MGSFSPLGQAAARSCLRRSVIENDVTTWKLHSRLAETQSEMCVPLIIFGEKLGVLVLDSARKAHLITMTLTAGIGADICAAAIQNAHNFDRNEAACLRGWSYGNPQPALFEMRIVEELERAAGFPGPHVSDHG